MSISGSCLLRFVSFCCFSIFFINRCSVSYIGVQFFSVFAVALSCFFSCSHCSDIKLFVVLSSILVAVPR